MPPLRIAAVELPQRYGPPAEAIGRVDRALSSLRDVDLALLHECALTGYVSPQGSYDLSRFAEPLDGPTAQALSGLARAHRLSLASTLVEREGASLYNTLCLFDPAGALVARWRKRHPWYPERWASPGDLGTPVVEHRGLRVTACVCFDIHFVADEAPGALAEADVLLFPSAWVDEPGGDARATALPELARRFALPIVNANWGYGKPPVWGQGRSRVVAADGSEALAPPGRGVRAAVAEIAPRGSATA